MAMLVGGCGYGSESDTATTLQNPAAEGSTAVASVNTITVVGSATVSSVPDQAALSLTVESDGTTPGAAMNANAAEVTKVLERLKAEGVDAAAIRTAYVNVYPIRTYNPDTGEETLAGYRAQNTVTVTLKGAAIADTAGRLLSAALEAGATSVSGPAWQLQDDTKAVAEALKQAVANARTKAEALAVAEGVGAGNVIMMNEGVVAQPSIQYSTDSMYARTAAGAVAETPISAGTLDVTASVTVTYTLDR